MTQTEDPSPLDAAALVGSIAADKAIGCGFGFILVVMDKEGNLSISGTLADGLASKTLYLASLRAAVCQGHLVTNPNRLSEG